jgi:hypothetical protein
MMQRAMELKQRKKLDAIKGDPFNVLSTDTLNQIALDASVKIGNDKSEACKVINDLIELDREQYAQFVDANPEILLPHNIESDFEMSRLPDNMVPIPEMISTPRGSIKEPDTSAPWTEVVKKGRRRNKARVESTKIVNNDRSRVEH